MEATCRHLDWINAEAVPSSEGCEDCLRTGGWWVHLRMCLVCGHAGCCDQSPNQHATAHWRATEHPIMRSMEVGEDWGWCYEDEAWLDAR